MKLFGKIPKIPIHLNGNVFYEEFECFKSKYRFRLELVLLKGNSLIGIQKLVILYTHSDLKIEMLTTSQ